MSNSYYVWLLAEISRANISKVVQLEFIYQTELDKLNVGIYLSVSTHLGEDIKVYITLSISDRGR